MSNPFMPGNGIEPRYLAGRDEYVELFTRSLKSFEDGLPRNTVVSGLRGTGKTVLLRRFKIIAESRGWLTVEREFNERFSEEEAFAEALVGDIISKATEVSMIQKAKQFGKRIGDVLKPEELTAYGISYKPYYKGKKQLLEDHLKEMLVKNWEVFKKTGKKGVVFLYDEFHTVKDAKDKKSFPLASLLGAISYAQRNGCKYYLCIGGLPIIMTNLKTAKTYTERMFELREAGNLEPIEAEQAIVNTLKSSEYEFEQDLVNKMISETRGYPYFIQFYGYFTIENTSKKKLALLDFTKIQEKLLRELDKNFFVDRLNLASGREKQILFAMAKIGDSDIETSKIKNASRMDKHVMLELIKRLIEKGLIYRSDRGKYGFSLPLFRDFLLRAR
ncbi:MAG: AAA family ATPase [Nitrosotalea sp.]